MMDGILSLIEGDSKTTLTHVECGWITPQPAGFSFAGR